MNNEISEKEEKIDKLCNDRFELRKLEEFYTNGKLEDIQEELEKEKEKIVNEMIEYAESRTEAVKWDREGCPLEYAVKYNPITINYMFFKPIIKLNGIEPIYNAEKLGVVYNYYNFLVSEVNDKIGSFPSSIKGFCKFAGITTTSLKKYRNSEDPYMRTVVNKIFDEIEEDNISMAQVGIIKERTTQFKMQSQNEVVVKTTPSVNINIVDKPDLNAINDKVSKYIKFIDEKE